MSTGSSTSPGADTLALWIVLAIATSAGALVHVVMSYDLTLQGVVLTPSEIAVTATLAGAGGTVVLVPFLLLLAGFN